VSPDRGRLGKVRSVRIGGEPEVTVVERAGRRPVGVGEEVARPEHSGDREGEEKDRNPEPAVVDLLPEAEDGGRIAGEADDVDRLADPETPPSLFVDADPSRPRFARRTALEDDPERRLRPVDALEALASEIDDPLVSAKGAGKYAAELEDVVDAEADGQGDHQEEREKDVREVAGSSDVRRHWSASAGFGSGLDFLL
jgi:hypothetical protein